jgi:hypothetical protein
LNLYIQNFDKARESDSHATRNRYTIKNRQDKEKEVEEFENIYTIYLDSKHFPAKAPPYLRSNHIITDSIIYVIPKSKEHCKILCFLIIQEIVILLIRK